MGRYGTTRVLCPVAPRVLELAQATDNGLSRTLIPKTTWIAGRGLRGCRATRSRVAAILSGRGKPRLVRRIALNTETRDSDAETESRVQSVSLDAVSVHPNRVPLVGLARQSRCSSGSGNR